MIVDVNALRRTRVRRVTLVTGLAATLALLVVSAIEPPLGLRLLVRRSPASVEEVDLRTSEIDTIAIDRWARRMGTSDVYLHWSGYVYATTTADYSFREYASGNADLWIDSRPLLRTNGADIRLAESTVHLTEGSHKIDVEFDQAGRPPALELRWNADGASVLQPLRAAFVSPQKLSSSGWRLRRVVFPLAYATCFLWLFVLIAAGWGLVVAAIGRERERATFPSVVTVFAAVLIVAGIWWGWPGEGWAPDEPAPAHVRDALEMKFSGGWHDIYPPFHFYLLAGSYAPFLAADRRGLIAAWAPEGLDALTLVGRILGVAMALGCLQLVARLGRRLHSRRVGLLSAVGCLTFLPFVYYGKTGNMDVPCLFWFALSLVFWLELRTSGSMAAYIGFAVASVIAVSTKDQAYGLYVLPVLAIVWTSVRDGRITRLVLGVLSAILAFVLCYNLPFNLSGFAGHVHSLTGPASSAYRMFPATLSGVAGLIRATLGQLFFGLGVPGVVAFALGLFSWYRHPAQRAWWLLLPVASYFLFFLLVVGYVYDRYLLPVLLICSIVAAFGLDGLFAEGIGPYKRTAGVALLVWLAWRAASLDALLVTDSRYAAERWLRRHVTPADTVAYFGDRVYLPRLDAFTHVALDGTREETLHAHPPFIVVNAEWMRRYPRNSPRSEWLMWLESGSSPYREVFRYKTPMGAAAPRFDRDSFSNLDKVNPQIVIFERTAQ